MKSTHSSVELRPWFRAFMFMVVAFSWFSTFGQEATTHYQWPSVSPDGKKLVYSVYEGEFRNMHLALHEIASNKTIVLLRGPVLEPKWSPDGKCILYSDTTGAIFLYDIAKMKSSLLVDPKITIGSQTPSWAPDGKSILIGAGKFPVIGIHRVAIADGLVTPLLADSSFNYGPSQSPVSKTIALRHIHLKDKSERGIFLYDIEKLRYSKLSPFGEYPVWGHNGEYLLCHGRGPGDTHPNVYMIEVSSGKTTRLTDDGAPSECPSINQKTMQIFFNRKNADGAWRIYSMNFKGEDVALVGR